MNGSTNVSSELSDLPTLRRDVEAKAHPEPPRKKRRFSSETANDLIFWAVQLCVLAAGLAVVWTKIEATNKAVLLLLQAQEKEIVITRKQADEAHEQALAARAAEHQRAIQLSATTDVLSGVLERVGKVQDDITQTLEQMRSINENVLIVSKTILDVSEATKTSSAQAASTAQSAAASAAAARSAAGSAASNSSATRALVRSKVATAADKQRILREEAQLNAKQQQLSKTIRQVKKKGPTLWQKMFNQ
jgi:hypothetical protein